MSSSQENNYQKLKELISQDKILLLPHKRFKGIRQSYVYARCGISLTYFQNAYKNGDVVLQFGESGTRIGHPVPWEEALTDYLQGKL